MFCQNQSFPTPLPTATRLFLTPSLPSNRSFPKMKKLPFTRALPFPTFPTAYLPRCTPQRCPRTPQPFKTVRCLSTCPNCPSNLPYLTLPAPKKQHPLQTPQHPKVPPVLSSPWSPPLPEQQRISSYHTLIPMKSISFSLETGNKNKILQLIQQSKLGLLFLCFLEGERIQFADQRVFESI